jgi:hypothetical protein
MNKTNQVIKVADSDKWILVDSKDRYSMLKYVTVKEE